MSENEWKRDRIGPQKVLSREETITKGEETSDEDAVSTVALSRNGSLTESEMKVAPPPSFWLVLAFRLFFLSHRQALLLPLSRVRFFFLQRNLRWGARYADFAYSVSSSRVLPRQKEEKKRGPGATGARGCVRNAPIWNVSKSHATHDPRTIGGKNNGKKNTHPQRTSCETKAPVSSLPPERTRAPGRQLAAGQERAAGRKREPGPEEPAPEREEARSRRRRYRRPRELLPTIARDRAPRRARSRR